MTPIFSSLSPRWILRTSFLAACASSVILLRGRVRTCSCEPGGALPGWICRRTNEPFGPRISCTTSSRRQPTTSVILPDLPWPTARMRSLAFSSPFCCAEPPGRISMIVT